MKRILYLVLLSTSVIFLHGCGDSESSKSSGISKSEALSLCRRDVERAVQRAGSDGSAMMRAGDGALEGCMAGYGFIDKPLNSEDALQGRLIYDGTCKACHSIGAADAPEIGDTSIWSELAAKGINTLVNNTKNGINAHPPKGLCFDCTDSDLKVAIIYMISESQ